jgi:hypothetical protein
MIKKTISSFNDIVLTKQKPLVLCDIDETILRYKYTYENFYQQMKLFSPTLSETEIKQNTEDDYYLYRILNNPSHTDSDGFTKMLERIEQLNGELMFVTARSLGSEKITKNHFKCIDIDYNKYKIHYSYVVNKGEYIKKYINNMDEYGEIIFIDDQEQILKNVRYFNPQITCYKFKYK